MDDVFDLIFYENLALSLENRLDFGYVGGGLGKMDGTYWVRSREWTWEKRTRTQLKTFNYPKTNIS